jgi:hypothetical protein
MVGGLWTADEEVIRFLVKKFVEKFPGKGDRYPFHWAIKYEMPMQAFQCMLRDFSEYYSQKNGDGITPLAYAMIQDVPLGMIEYLVRENPTAAIQDLMSM